MIACDEQTQCQTCDMVCKVKLIVWPTRTLEASDIVFTALGTAPFYLTLVDICNRMNTSVFATLYTL